MLKVKLTGEQYNNNAYLAKKFHHRLLLDDVFTIEQDILNDFIMTQHALECAIKYEIISLPDLDEVQEQLDKLQQLLNKLRGKE